MMPNSPLAVAQAWVDAANAQDIERLVALSDANIELVGPRGSGYGHDLLRQWAARAGLTLTTTRWFANHGSVVMEQRGTWRSLDTGEVTGEKPVASAFRVADGLVTQYARYDTLAEALTAVGLDADDEVLRS